MVCALYIRLHFLKIGLTQRECSHIQCVSHLHTYIHISIHIYKNFERFQCCEVQCFGDWACRAASLTPVHANSYDRDPACLLECPSSLISLNLPTELTASGVDMGTRDPASPNPRCPDLVAKKRRMQRRIDKTKRVGGPKSQSGKY